jgi:hypothetical protein
MKRCSRCGIEKDESEFGQDVYRKDGLRSYCKHCSNQIAQASRVKHPGQRSASDKAYYEKTKVNIEKFREKSRAHKKKYKKQYEAHLKVKWEVKSGRLQPVSECQCQKCGKVAEEYHHPDYSKPLEVIPLCKACHVKLHKALKKLG